MANNTCMTKTHLSTLTERERMQILECKHTQHLNRLLQCIKNELRTVLKFSTYLYLFDLNSAGKTVSTIYHHDLQRKVAKICLHSLLLCLTRTNPFS